MKKKLPFLCILLFVLCASSSFSQAPFIRFQKNVGTNGTSYEPEFYGTIGGVALIPKVHMQAGNGNIIVAGNSMTGFPATFVCEVNAQDSILWSKAWSNIRYNGQTYVDAQLRSLQPAVDSGFIMMGFLRQGSDAWAVRTNKRGDSVWQRFYGGSAYDEGAYLCRVQNKGYIFIGTSSSFDGTLTSARTADSATKGRVWICRLDKGGNPLWSRCFGYPSGTADRGIIIKPTTDGGFICGANMQSKGYADGSYHGARDIWLSKLDSSGIIQWAKYYGGTADDLLGDVEETADGGFLFVGSTASNNGDVTGNNGLTDAWVVKTTANGSVSWQKCLGGSLNDFLVDVIQTQDGGYVSVGTTFSGYGQNASSSDSINVLLTKLTSDGTLVWAKQFGGNYQDYGRNVLQTGDNDYLISGTNLSYFGDPVYNKNWYARLGNTSRIKGSVYYDNNNNGIKDVGEQWADNITVTASKQNNYLRSSIVTNGTFSIEVDTGSYVTKVSLYSAYYNVLPTTATSTFTSYFQTDSVGFRLVPGPGRQDLQINIAPLTAARPGFSADYRILYKNKGTSVINNGTVILKKDPRLNFISATPSAAYNNGDSLRWNFGVLNPNDSTSIFIHTVIAPPPAVNNGDSLTLRCFIEPVAGDETPADDTAYLKQIVVGSFDPNDKTEANGGLVDRSFIQKGSLLNYSIRFQNTGTDTAFTVVVRDTLSNRVDASTLEMVAASHPYTLTVENGVNLTWRFNNIHLPDSNRNEPGSHGYIAYRIKPKSDVAVGETIHNTASIYFDYNLPVLTNDAATKVQANISVLPQGLLRFYGNQQGNAVSLFWKTALDAGVSRFEIERSTNGTSFTSIGFVSAQRSTIDYAFPDNTNGLSTPALFYRLKMFLENGGSRYSDVLLFKQNKGVSTLDVYPNPIKQQGFVAFETLRAGRAELQITDAAGKLLSREVLQVQPGRNVVPLTRTKIMSAGVYTVRLVLDVEVKSTAFSVF